MGKLIRKQEALDGSIFSRDLREYVVPTRVINKLKTFDDPKEQTEDYRDMLRAMFNRCAIQMSCGGALCLFCWMKDTCNALRNVLNQKEDT